MTVAPAYAMPLTYIGNETIQNLTKSPLTAVIYPSSLKVSFIEMTPFITANLDF